VAQHEFAAGRVTTLSFKIVLSARERSRSRSGRQSDLSGRAQRPTIASPFETLMRGAASRLSWLSPFPSAWPIIVEKRSLPTLRCRRAIAN